MPKKIKPYGSGDVKAGKIFYIMKTVAKSIITLLAGVLLSSFAYAQDFGGGFPGGGFPGGGFPGGGGFPQMMGQNLPAASEVAKERANEMDRELTLTKKQLKKIVKHFKKEVEFERQNMPFGGMAGRMGQMPEGMQRPQGMPQGMPQGRMQGEGGQRQQRGEVSGQRGEGRGQGMREMPAEMREMMEKRQKENEEKKAKFDAKQDKELQKILTPEQYGRWRGKHPLK